MWNFKEVLKKKSIMQCVMLAVILCFAGLLLAGCAPRSGDAAAGYPQRDPFYWEEVSDENIP